MPVIGFLSSASPDVYAIRLRAFHEGLKVLGYVEGQNLEIEYRWAAGQNHRLPALAAELVQRQVAVIAAGGGASAGRRGKGGDCDDSDCLRCGSRPGRGGPCCQPEPTRRQPDGRDQPERRGRAE